MGMTSTLISLFCGFMIKQENFATFWLFLYWLDPLHYALQGLTMTQFHGDTTTITNIDGTTTTAEAFIGNYFASWEYSQLGNDIVALVMFIVFFRVGTFLALTFLRHEKR
jgi:ABC-type multidrug transport system permease subunit